MLQFIAQRNDRYTIPELIQMAIEGGCKWVQLHVPEMDDAAIRELAAEVVPLCRETSTMLTIEDHIDLAVELGLHGFLLCDPTLSPRDIRDQYGPEAIIGVQIQSATQATALRELDVDYAAFIPGMPIDKLAENVAIIRQDGLTIPLVASGAYAIDMLPDIMATGVNGLALSSTISDSADPVETTAEILRIITPE